jgi:hypothetical protein
MELAPQMLIIKSFLEHLEYTLEKGRRAAKLPAALRFSGTMAI